MAGPFQADLEGVALSQAVDGLGKREGAGEGAGVAEDVADGEGVPLGHFVAGKGCRVEATPGLAKGGEVARVVEVGGEQVLGLGKVAARRADPDGVAEGGLAADRGRGAAGLEGRGPRRQAAAEDVLDRIVALDEIGPFAIVPI